MPDAELIDQQGETFDLREGTAGKITFLFFGYTYCPDVCPLTMAAVARGLEQLDPAERDQVETVFVSLDAARDDPARIRSWLGGIDPSFVGLTGEQEHLEEVLGQIGWKMPPIPPHEGPDYQVPHPATLYLFTPDGLGRFGYPAGNVDPESIAQDVRRLEQVDW
jgi:protein SCO1/2